ncbi:MAG: hypothetical protein JWR26_4249 [Pedosphaera sp.]|nr:hypothetical protein [Pedosphaera sp.]
MLFLQDLRRKNPVRARELLVSTWKEESPEERGRFIAVFEIGLTAEDEIFLEAALDDKRKEVRRTAAVLLGQIPDSYLVRRMIDRTKPLLKYVAGEAGKMLKLKKAKPASIEITLPAECDKAMQRDGIEPKPQQGTGEKAWWLIQMLESVPLNTWTTEWQATPAEILAGSLNSEWKDELFEAWMRATARQKNGQWAEVLFSAALEGKRPDKLEGILAAMSSNQREMKISELLKETKVREHHGTLVLQSGQQWSPEFSRTVLAWLKQLSAEPSGDWVLRNQLKDFAPRLAPSVLPETFNGWPAESKGWEFWSKGVDEFLAMAQFRADLHTAFTLPINKP